MEENHKSVARILRSKDVISGVFVLAGAAVFWIAAISLPGSRGFQFGPGTAPRLFIVCMVIVAFVVIAQAFVLKVSEPFDLPRLRPLACVLGAMAVFAFGVETLGLVLTGFLVLMLASAATTEVRWIEATIFSLVFSLVCSTLFVLGLDVSLPLWPGL